MADVITNAPLEERSANLLETAWAYAVPDINNRLNREMHERFLTGINASPDEYKRGMDAYLLAQNANDFRTSGAVFSQIASTKSPDELLNGFAAANPGQKPFVDAISGDEVLKSKIHEAISKDPTTFYNFTSLISGRDGIDNQDLVASMADPKNREILGNVLSEIANKDSVTGDMLATSLSQNGVALKTQDFVAHKSGANFLASLTDTKIIDGVPAFWAGEDFKRIGGIDTSTEAGKAEQTKALQDLIATKTPSQLLNAFEAASPDAKPLLNIVRNDAQLSESIHNLIVKDETALQGLQSMIGPGSSMNAAGLTNALADGQTRNGVIQMLDMVAERDDLVFQDVAEALESGSMLQQDPGNRTSQKRYADALKKFGMMDNRIALGALMADPMAAMMNAFENPAAFFKDLRAALGDNIAPGGFVDSLLNITEQGIASFSQDQNIRGFMETYDLKGTFNEVTNFQNNLGIKPIHPDVQAMNDNIVAGSANGSTEPTALDIKTGGPNGQLANSFAPSSAGIKIPEEIKKFGNDMVASQANANAQFGMAM